MDPTTVTAEALLRKHPERAKWENRWADYRLTYLGGFEFLLAAGQWASLSQSSAANLGIPTGLAITRRARRFLWQLEGEPDTKYQNRWERASYVNYMAAIVDYFRHWLYSQPPQIRPVDQADIPDWWAPFYENASGGGLSLIDVARESFLDVLIYQRAGWLLGRADDVADKGDDAQVVLTPYNGSEILDWQCSPTGELEWVTLCKERTTRAFPDERVKVQVVTYVDRVSWHTWEITPGKEEEDAAFRYIGGADHDLGEVPFVMRHVPHGLWVADKLFSPCMSLFNRTNMLEHGELLGCYVQPFIRSQEGREAESRILGEGMVLNLRAGDGDRQPEEFGWIAPDIAPMEHIAERLKQDRDEIYRTVHQMSLAVDSQAVGAIARSGTSKIEDRRATEIILAGYGRYEIRALVQTANLLSKIYGDNLTWVGDGFENFQTSTLDEELQIAALAQAFNIKSPTFNGELQKMIATGRVMPHLDEATKEKIEQEIEDAIEDEAANQAAQVQSIDADGQPVSSASTLNDAAAQDAQLATKPAEGDKAA